MVIFVLFLRFFSCIQSLHSELFFDASTLLLILKINNPDGVLIDLSDRNNLGGGGSSGGTPQPPGFIGYPHAPSLPAMPMPPTSAPFNYPNMGGGGSGSGGGGMSSGSASAPPFNYNIPPNQEKKDLNINTHFLNVSFCRSFSNF